MENCPKDPNKEFYSVRAVVTNGQGPKISDQSLTICNHDYSIIEPFLQPTCNQIQDVLFLAVGRGSDYQFLPIQYAKRLPNTYRQFRADSDDGNLTFSQPNLAQTPTLQEISH
jgi:hypothetical protein